MDENQLSLAVYPLTLRLLAGAGFRLPHYAGALFRGAFGKLFRELSCTTGAPACTGCPNRSACRYAQVFESPVDPARHPVLHGLPFAPHPFILTPPLDAAGQAGPKPEHSVSLTLIGPGLAHLAGIISVFSEMGRRGAHGGPFRLASAISSHAPTRTVYDGRLGRLVAPPLPWRPQPRPGIRRLRLTFRTPVRLRKNGRYNASPAFADLAQALFRRIHFLAALYGRAPASPDWTHPFLALADTLRTEHSSFELFRWDRFSHRQDRRIPMDGLLGSITVSGPLDPLLPYLQLGEQVHLGSATAMGMGRYEIDV